MLRASCGPGRLPAIAGVVQRRCAAAAARKHPAVAARQVLRLVHPGKSGSLPGNAVAIDPTRPVPEPVVSDIAARLRTALEDRYLIEEEIGRGGAATVFLAEDIKHARKVAIKVLRPGTPGGYEPQRFLREIRIAARLAHPQILPLHDSGECEGLLYFVMPYAGLRVAARPARARRAAAGRRGAAHHARRGRGAGLRPPPQRDPPGHQAGEHPAAGRRAGGGRLRGGHGHLRRRRRQRLHHRPRLRRRHPGVHEPRAGQRRGRARRPDRPVQPRVRPVRDAGGCAAVRRQRRAGHHGAARGRGPGADPDPPSRPCRPPWSGRSSARSPSRPATGSPP